MPNRGHRPVVITGLGPICALGVGIDPFWSALCEGRSAIKQFSRLDAIGFSCSLAGEVPDDLFDVKSTVPKSYRKATKVMARDTELAVGAAAAAVAHANLTTRGTNPDAQSTIPPERFGCHIGAGLIAADENELTAALVTSRNDEGRVDLPSWGATGMTNLTPLWLLKYLPNMLACHVTIIHDCEGPSNTITCAEASSGLSIGESMRVIGRGDADACLSGGAESKLNLMGYLRQEFAGRLAPDDANEPATQRIKPFDPRATGTILGEGGGIIILEAEETARARGATILASLRGFGASQGFNTDTIGLDPDPDPATSGIADAILSALEDAAITPAEIDAVVPLGSGVPSFDRAESQSIQSVFGPRAAQIPLITLTPNLGECGAGTGALQVIAAVQALVTQTLPARLNAASTPGLNAAAAPSQPANLRNILVTTAGLGGQNVAMILGRIA